MKNNINLIARGLAIIIRLFFLSCPLSIYLASCTTKTDIDLPIVNKITPLGLAKVLSEQSVPIRDDIAHLKSPGKFLSIKGIDSLIILDNKQILLCINDTVQKTIGKVGAAPGEFKVITAACIYKDTLFILDPVNSKILGYSIQKGDCVFEFMCPNLHTVSAIYRLNQGFFLVNGNYDPSFKDKPNTVLAHILKQQDTSFTPLNLTVNALDFTFFLDILVGGTPNCMGLHGNKLYIGFPCANRMAVFDITSQRFSFITLKQAINLDARPKKSSGLNQHTLDGLERIYGVYTTPSNLITSSYVYRDGKGYQYTRIYSYQGEYLGEIRYPYSEVIHTIYASDAHLYTLTRNDTSSASSMYPFAILHQSYLCKKD
jgi:hypothetical protein